MSKKYIVSLTSEERLLLEQLTKKGCAPAYKINHARILLKADTNQESGGWIDEAISKALDISIPTTLAGAAIVRRAKHRSSTYKGNL